MPLLGQASGDWTESSSALRILHVGIRNTVGILTDDAFTQTNPPQVTGAGTISQSAGMNTAVLGVLGGSVAFTRGDIGPNYVGGPTAVGVAGVRPLGVFINNAVGRPYENTPGPASGIGPYVSGMGTYGNSLYETQNIDSSADLNYTTGDRLFASQNGYLTNVDANNNRLEQANATLFGILKMPADSVQPEIVYDQRI
jgi:hypothetical protein